MELTSYCLWLDSQMKVSLLAEVQEEGLGEELPLEVEEEGLQGVEVAQEDEALGALLSVGVEDVEVLVDLVEEEVQEAEVVEEGGAEHNIKSFDVNFNVHIYSTEYNSLLQLVVCYLSLRSKYYPVKRLAAIPGHSLLLKRTTRNLD